MELLATEWLASLVLLLAGFAALQIWTGGLTKQPTKGCWVNKARSERLVKSTKVRGGLVAIGDTNFN